ncbi:MAG: sigma-70 family RNA polymerase sigma factor, partial [Acidobacteria bacterium]|nr:sigma-70 family RNA polymerase sigma factor [Acidobacteriota bacterium]
MPELVAELDAYRPGLTGHCYRMLGSVVDAEDAVQETMVRAWRHGERFEGRAAVKTWLYRIATNVCLDEIAARSRRVRPVEERPVGAVDDELSMEPRRHWLEPVPDAAVLPAKADPEELAVLRQSIRLAFVAALQHLPAKQRAVLLMREVLGWSAAEVAEVLEISVAAVNSALQRARATLAERDLDRRLPAEEPAAESEQELLERYVSAFEAYDVDGLAALLHEDAVFSMPPYTLWLRGPDSVRTWLSGRGSGCRGSRLVPTAACGLPAFGQYRASADGGHEPWALVVLEIEDG